MSVLATELRLSIRLLLRSPGLTLVATSALAVGIGVNVTLFGFVNAVVFTPLEVPGPDRIVRADAGGPDLMRLVPESDYEAYRDRNQSFDQLAFSHHGWVSPITVDGLLQATAVTPVTGNYFQALGVSAAEGRAITPADDEPGAPPVVMLSAEGKRRLFGTNRNVVGESMLIAGTAYAIVGVAPKSFRGTTYPGIPQIYSTFEPTRRLGKPITGYLIGRLEPGVSPGEAGADLERIADQLSAESGERTTIATYPGTASNPAAMEMWTPIALLFMAVAGAVLWIACSNIAMLLLARGASRRREIGVRIALGAGRTRILRQLLIESAVLALLGGGGAFIGAHVTASALTRIYLPVPMPIALAYALDWRVFAFAVGLCLVATLLFGLGPSLHALDTDVVSSIKQGEHGTSVGSSKTSFALVVSQAAMATALLALAAVMTRSVVIPPDPLLETNGVAIGTARLAGGIDSPERRADYVRDVLEGLEARSGVLAASAAHAIPLTFNQGPPAARRYHRADDDSAEDASRPLIYDNRIAPRYFDTLGIPLRAGRDFDARDRLDAPPVAIVNETLAERFWPRGDAVGRSLLAPGGERLEIVAVAADSKYYARDEAPRAFVYRPIAQLPSDTPTFFFHSELPTEEAITSLREEMAAASAEVAPYGLNSLEERLTPGVHVAVGWVTGVLGMLGVGLGAVGTYGLVAWTVHERRRELGLRLALGASTASLVRLITDRGLAWGGLGAALGLTAFSLGVRLLGSFLRGVPGVEPISLIVVLAIVLGSVFLSCFVPARRAAANDPAVTLREG